MNLLLRIPGPAASGVSCPGQYAPGQNSKVTAARIDCVSGSQDITIALTLGGTTTDVELTIPAGQTGVDLDGLDLAIPNGACVGATVVASDDPETVPDDVSIVLTVDAQESATYSGAELAIRYVGEYLTLWMWDYNPITGEYSERSGEYDADHGTLESGTGSLTLELDGSTVAVIDTALHVVELTQTEHFATPLPRFEFVIGGVVAASLSADGLRAPQFSSPAHVAAESFAFWIGGQARCAIAADGVSAPGYSEEEL